MNRTASTFGGLSICLRCQYRLATRREHFPNLRYPVLGPAHARKLSYVHRKAQGQFHHHNNSPDVADSTPTCGHERSTLAYRPDLAHGHRRIKLHRKDALGVDSLGRPAEVLVVNNPQEEPVNVLHVRRSDQYGGEEPPASANEMLEGIKAEQGIPSERGVAKNLEQLRDTWVSYRKRKGRPLSPAEHDDLLARLDAGFTVKQLVGYYVRTASGLIAHPSNLDQPYSTSTYTRSSWIAGTTPFPGDASARLKNSKSMAKDLQQVGVNVDGEMADPRVPQIKANTPKRTIIEKVLSECWQLRSARDEDAMGELDVWIQPEHNHLLLNHDRDILRRLSERYGAKIDTSRSHNIIRITSDRGVCGDIFEFLIYILRRIGSEQVELVPYQGLGTGKHPSVEAMKDPRYCEEIQQLTNTIIKPVPSGAGRVSSPQKVIIYYLGPSKDDLVDAQRLLLQPGLTNNVHSSAAHWSPPSNNLSAAASPVDVGIGLPLANRVQQWSRWVLPKERRLVPTGWSTAPIRRLRGIDLRTAQKAYEGQVIHEPPATNVADSEMARWPRHTSQRITLDLGNVLYPTKAVNDLKFSARGPAGERLSSVFVRSLGSPRQFLSNNLGLKPPSIAAYDGKLHSIEELCIRMAPRLDYMQSTQRSTQIPEMEILINVDKYKKTTSLGRVRLIFEIRQSDLLLPDQPVDLRFATELYVNAKDPRENLPQVSDFLASSNLNIWGTDRLKTPQTLTMPTPRYSIPDTSRENQQDRYSKEESTRTNTLKDVEYMFVSLEHRSDLVERRLGHDVVYSVIEAGRTGGRREGLRIISPPTPLKNRGSALTEIANTLIASSLSRLPANSDPDLVPDSPPRQINTAELS